MVFAPQCPGTTRGTGTTGVSLKPQNCNYLPVDLGQSCFFSPVILLTDMRHLDFQWFWKGPYTGQIIDENFVGAK